MVAARSRKPAGRVALMLVSLFLVCCGRAFLPAGRPFATRMLQRNNETRPVHQGDGSTFSIPRCGRSTPVTAGCPTTRSPSRKARQVLALVDPADYQRYCMQVAR